MFDNRDIGSPATTPTIWTQGQTPQYPDNFGGLIKLAMDVLRSSAWNSQQGGGQTRPGTPAPRLSICVHTKDASGAPSQTQYITAGFASPGCPNCNPAAGAHPQDCGYVPAQNCPAQQDHWHKQFSNDLAQINDTLGKYAVRLQTIEGHLKIPQGAANEHKTDKKNQT